MWGSVGAHRHKLEPMKTFEEDTFTFSAMSRPSYVHNIEVIGVRTTCRWPSQAGLGNSLDCASAFLLLPRAILFLPLQIAHSFLVSTMAGPKVRSVSSKRLGENFVGNPP